ncbi:MAG: cyclic nucleotide-binding domain-containing protein [Desulfobacteraceae bacterium]|jgi:CRP-like cAMP-binding protein
MTGPSVLQGELSFLHLADLFQLLGGNVNTGILHVRTPTVPYPAVVYFEEGNPISASCGDLRGIDAINALFGWMEGRFEFQEKAIQAPRTIKKGRMQIVLDALRLLDEGEIEKVGLPEDKETAPPSQKKGIGNLLWESMPVIKGPVIDYMYVVEEEEFPAGHRVVAEGRHGSWIWVILEGEVEILRETPKGPITIARLGEGSYIGTFTIFLFEGSIRSAHVSAVGNVRLGLLDTQRLYGEFASLSAEFRGLLLSLSRRLIKTSDRVVELYTKQKKRPISIKDKDVFLKMGTSKEQAYSITSGETCVVTKTKKGALPLISLEKEDVFGNLPFFQTGQEPYAASVFASKDIEVQVLDTAQLQSEFDRCSLTFRSLVENACTSISITSQIASHIADG